MILRQGIDLISVKRMRQAVERQGRSFVRRIFTSAEEKYCESRKMKYEHYAARFAAKEAAMKAFHVRGKARFSFREIEIRREPTGRPFIYLSPSARKIFKVPKTAKIDVSMTHERDYAAATVLVLFPDKERK